MAEMRLESGILGIPARSLVLLFSSPSLRRFRVFSAPRLMVGGLISTSRGTSPGAPLGPKERYGAAYGGITTRVRNFGDFWPGLWFSFVVSPSAAVSRI